MRGGFQPVAASIGKQEAGDGGQRECGRQRSGGSGAGRALAQAVDVGCEARRVRSSWRGSVLQTGHEIRFRARRLWSACDEAR